jgi:hypothetical protein
MATKAEKEQYAKLARLGCILCAQNGVKTDDSPTEIHHIRRFGNPRALSPCITLCAWHHRLGPAAVHQIGKKAFARYWGYSEEDLLEKLNDLLQEKG